MNSLVICTGEINVKEGEIGIAYSTRERLEILKKNSGSDARREGTPRKPRAWMGVQELRLHVAWIHVAQDKVVPVGNDVFHPVWYYFWTA